MAMERKNMNFSYWEKEAFLKNIDFFVVGGGIVGLSAATHLKVKHPQSRVVVAERDVFSAGASTKNAGFACFGSPTELLDDLTRMSEDAVFELVARRYKGLNYLRSWLGDAQIGYEACGGYELFSSSEQKVWEEVCDQLAGLNNKLHNTLSIRPYTRLGELPSHWPFQGFSGAISNSFEGAIHTGKMMRALWAKAAEQGVELWNGFAIETLVTSETGVDVKVGDTVFTPNKVVVCTNAFARQLLPQLEVQPVRNQVVVTSVIPGLRLEGTFHMDKGYRYFRAVDGRILVGGFRNWALEEETTDQFGLTPVIQELLENFLRNNIIPHQPFSIEHRWSGILGMGHDKSAIVQRLNDHLAVAVRMGGMGVAIGSWIGKEAADLF
jgi:gamma-glutamylputrescine oxidase